jgi:phosphohistidine phosphatase
VQRLAVNGSRELFSVSLDFTGQKDGVSSAAGSDSMKLYLVQHGAALTKEENPDRPLSEVGREDVRSLAMLIPKEGLANVSILHSTKLRARETAEMIAAAVGLRAEEVEGLGPSDSVAAWLKRAAEAGDDLMLVGHQPFVGRLATSLLAGREEPAAVSFEPGAAVCLERADDGSWAVRWMIGPSLDRLAAT